MQDKLIDFSLSKPKWVFLGVFLLTAIGGVLLPGIVIDTDPENMLPANQPDRVFHNQIKHDFALHDMIVVGAINESDQGIFNPQSLQALVQLVDGIKTIPGVIDYDLMAISNVDNIVQQSPGTIRFEWLMQQAPKTQADATEIAKKIERLPLLKNTLVSKDRKATAIYVPIQSKDESHQISLKIKQLIQGLDSVDSYHITGLPVAEDTFGYQMFVQMGISAPLAGLMIFVLMWYFFRNVRFVIAPMIIAMASVIITMGVMIGMGYTVHIMSSMIPIFLMPISVVDAIHIMSDFVENYDAKANRIKAERTNVIRGTLKRLYVPMFYTSVTSAIGFLSLLLTPIPPVQVFGVFVAFGILLSFLLTIVFIPAYLMVLKPASLASLTAIHHSRSKLSAVMKKLGTFSTRRSGLVLTGFTILMAVSVWGVTYIQINDNPVRWFKADHPIRIADKALNDHFAGTYDAYLVLESDSKVVEQDLLSKIDDLPTNIRQHAYNKLQAQGPLATKISDTLFWAEDQSFEQENHAFDDLIIILEQANAHLAYFKSPHNLAYIEQLQKRLTDSGLVGKSNSLADIVKTVNRDLRSGEAADFELPVSSAGVAQTLLQYQSSHRPQDLWHFVSKDYADSVIWLQLRSGDNQDMTQVVDATNQFIKQYPAPDGLSIQWAGKTYLNKVWQDEMVIGMLSSLIWAFVTVFVIMVVLFRSLIFGILAMLPLTVTITFIYGLIGWLGKDYDMPIAVLSSLTLGLSVDFAIHFLQRARTIYDETKDMQLTLRKMFDEPAAAISRNAVVIAIGFTPLLLAPLVPYITVGFFLTSIMAISALVTLMLLPACMRLFRKHVFR